MVTTIVITKNVHIPHGMHVILHYILPYGIHINCTCTCMPTYFVEKSGSNIVKMSKKSKQTTFLLVIPHLQTCTINSCTFTMHMYNVYTCTLYTYTAYVHVHVHVDDRP